MTTLKRFLTLFLISTLSAFTMHVWGETATLDAVSTKDVASTAGASVSLSFSGVTCTCTKNSANSPGFYTKDGIVRYYGSDVMTLSVASGNTITQIDFSYYSGTSTAGTASSGTLTGSQWKGSAASVSFTGTGTTKISGITVTYSAGSSYTITVESNNDSWGTVSGSTTITATPAPGYRIKDSKPYTVTSGSATVTRGTGTDSNKFTVSASSDCTVRINFEAIPTHAIRFFNNGTQIGATQNIAEGSSPVVPSDPAACDEGYAFVGWWTAELAEDNTTAETWVTDFTVSGAQDYYAVFSHPDDEGGGTVTFNFATIAEANGWAHDSNHPDISISPINIHVSKTSGSYQGRWWNNDKTFRIYAANTITISSTAGDITAVSSEPGRTFTISDGKATYNAATNFTSISVTYGTTYYTTDCGAACSTPTLEFDVTEVTKFDGDAPFIKTATLSNNPLGGTITYSSNLPSKAEVNATTGEVTIHDAMSSTPIVITATVDKVTSGVDCQKKVTASYTLNIYNHVTWSVNGASYSAGAPTTQTTEGGSIEAYPTDPDGSTACGGKTFVGWTTAAYEGDTKPGTLFTSLSSMSGVHITENTTFHAVFAESGGSGDEVFKKGTSADLTDGQTVIIVNAAYKKALSSTFTASGKTLSAVSVSITDDEIKNPVSTIKWTVVKSGSVYQLMQGSDYLWAGYNEGYTLNSSDDYDDTWSVSTSGSHYILTNDYYSRKLEYYPTNDEFTTYTGSGDYYAVDFYFPHTPYTDYSTTCGPNIKAQEVEYLTSTKDQTVKSQAITVKGSSLTGATLSANISGANASFFSCSLEASTITAGTIETTYIISYTPTAFGDAQHTATLTFTDGTTDSDPITLHGRSLPEQFAIVAFDGANYYALDGTMTGTATTVKPLPVTVTAGAVDLCPSQAVFTLTELDIPNENVHFVGPTNRRLYGGSSTGLNMHSSSSTDGTGWLLTTADFNTYHITNATSTSRGIMYNSTYDAFGHYASGNYSAANYYGNLQLLPITMQCTCLEKPIVTCVAKASKATLTWDPIAGAVSYEITCSGGTYSSSVTGLTATISGLSENTNYTYSVKAVAAGTDCSMAFNGAFKTTNCDDVPYAINVTPGIKTATFKWQMESSTAKICIYSNKECTAAVGSEHSGETSPAVVTGLEENTKYYFKILAGPTETCESAVDSFLTNSTSVEIAEWFTDSIRINLDADAHASVLIEDKAEKQTETTNYADKLFISKYFEADGNNKMIAIYNGTKDPIDITNMWLYRSEINASEKGICLKKFGKTPGKIAPNEEIIIMRFTTDSDGAIKCAEKEENYDEWNIIKAETTDGNGNNIYNWLTFSGPQSIGLYDNSTSKFIDIIGASTNSSGTGELVQIEASIKHPCSNTQNTNNDGSGFSANGKEVETDNDIVLSTNRCLLIRKNTVKSGDNAVANNVYTTQQECSSEIGQAFTTLGTEWVGYIIGKGADAADKTCEGLAFVGGFDYQGYYSKFDSITTVEEIGGKRNEDGTYTIPIPQLDTLSCTMMRVKVYEGSTEKASREYKVPIMIDAATTTAADKYFHSYARENNSADVCKECDVVILSSGTLTKASSDNAKDIPEVRNLTIYPGGKLIVPEGAKYEYTVNSIQFRVQGEQTPLAQLKGDLITKDQQVIVSRRIPNDRYYFFSLPYDCNISDIRWSNGETPDRGTEYQIVEYDGETRAIEGSTKGAPGHWKPAGSVLKAGVGYNIAVNSKYLKELIFPMAISSTNLTNEEDTKTSNKVAIAKHTGSSSINNHNWNLIAHPYVSAFNAYDDGKIKAGYLHCVSPKTETEDAVWVYEDESHVYLTMPSFNAGKITYEQTLSSTVGTLNPFLAVFVQGASEGDLTFAQSNRKLSAPARHLAAAENEDESIFVGVTLSGNEMSDQANLRIRPDFTNEYQLGYDLQKFTTFYTARPQIYMKPADLQLAFQAVSDSVAKNTWMPMGVYCYEAGTFTFALSKDYPIDEVEAVYLYDKTTGTTTNLLYDTYTINTTKQLYTNTRFSLNVLLNRRVPQVATDIPITDAPESMTRKLLINGNVYIQRGNKIYDVTGKQVANQ